MKECEYTITKRENKNGHTFVFVKYENKVGIKSGEIFILKESTKGQIIDLIETDKIKDSDKYVDSFSPTGKGFLDACMLINSLKKELVDKVGDTNDNS